MAIYRAMGASPRTIFTLLVVEAALTAFVGALLGLGLLYLSLVIGQPIIDSAFGLFLPIEPPAWREIWTLCVVVIASAIVSLLPAIHAYRLSLSDGMMVRT